MKKDDLFLGVFESKPVLNCTHSSVVNGPAIGSKHFILSSLYLVLSLEIPMIPNLHVLTVVLTNWPQTCRRRNRKVRRQQSHLVFGWFSDCHNVIPFDQPESRRIN